jgi:hypothetical protein
MNRPCSILASGLLVACPAPDDSVPGDDTAPPEIELVCDEGEIPDGDVCVPEACGTGTWGDIAGDDSTIYVDLAATEGGDGSAEAPFASITEALEEAPTGALIAVAAGRYVENLSADSSVSGLHLAGRCRELVVLDASAGSSDTPGLRLELSAGSATISGLTIRDANYAGLIVTSGEVTLRRVSVIGNAYSGMGVVGSALVHDASVVAEDCEFAENVGSNIGMFYSRAQLELRGSVVRDAQRGAAGQSGLGIAVEEGASLVVEASEVLRNYNQGILVEAGSSVVVRGSRIEGGLPDPSGLYGYGLQIDDATVEIESSELVGNSHAGLVAQGETLLTIRDTIIRDTATTGYGSFGGAVQVGGGAALVMDGCELSNNASFGVTLTDGASAVVTDTLILGTTTNGLGEAWGALWAQGGSTLEVDGCTIDGASTTGICAAEVGTTVAVTDTVVRGVHPDGSALYGHGLNIGGGATLVGSGLTLEDNTGVAVLATDAGSSVSLVDSTIRATHRGDFYTVAQGIAVQQGANFLGERVELEDTQGPALLAAYAPTVLECVSCDLTGAEFAGAVALGGASLVLDEARILESQPGSNVGGGVGIYADPWGWGAPSVLVTDSEITDNPIAGVWLTGGGSVQFVNSTIGGGEGEERGGLQRCGDAVYARSGITAWDGEQGLLLQGNTLLEGRGAGLFLDGADASLAGNTWQDNSVDLIRQGADCGAAPAGLDTEPIDSIEQCPTWDYSVCGDSFELMLALSAPETL